MVDTEAIWVYVVVVVDEWMWNVWRSNEDGLREVEEGFYRGVEKVDERIEEERVKEVGPSGWNHVMIMDHD